MHQINTGDYVVKMQGERMTVVARFLELPKHIRSDGGDTVEITVVPRMRGPVKIENSRKPVDLSVRKYSASFTLMPPFCYAPGVFPVQYWRYNGTDDTLDAFEDDGFITGSLEQPAQMGNNKVAFALNLLYEAMFVDRDHEFEKHLLEAANKMDAGRLGKLSYIALRMEEFFRHKSWTYQSAKATTEGKKTDDKQ